MSTNFDYDDVGSADTTVGKGVYLEPGAYTLKIRKCLDKKFRASAKEGFIAEFDVLESTNPKFPVGTQASWIQSLANVDMAKKGLKEFALAVIGRDPRAKEQPEAIVKGLGKLIMAAKDNNIFEGKVVKCKVSVIMTKGPPSKEFNLHTFEPVAAPAT